LKAGFLTGAGGFGMAFTPLGFQTPVADPGVPSGAFLEKKLRIEPFLEPTLEDCFFNDEGAGVTAFSAFTMVAGGCRQTMCARKRKEEVYDKAIGEDVLNDRDLET